VVLGVRVCVRLPSPLPFVLCVMAMACAGGRLANARKWSCGARHEPTSAAGATLCLSVPTFAPRAGRVGPYSAVGTNGSTVCVQAHACIQQTALDLVHDGWTVHVPADAVSSQRPFDRSTALRLLERGGVHVTTVRAGPGARACTSMVPPDGNGVRCGCGRWRA
jgi:hypothetical protein